MNKYKRQQDILKLKCHKSYGVFSEGKYYSGILESNLLYITILIYEGDVCDNNLTRFLYDDTFKISGDCLWPYYKEYFLCQKTTNRLNKLDKLGII